MEEWSSLAIFSRRLEVSSSHSMACYDSLYVSCRWNRWLIELCLFCIAFLNNPSLCVTLVVVQFSHSEHHGAISFLSTKYGLDGVSNFLSIALYQASPTSAVDEAFCPILFNIRNTGSCEGSCTTRSTPRSHNYEIIFFDSSPKGLYVQLSCRSAIRASLFGWFLTWLSADHSSSIVFLFDCSTWNTLDSEGNFKFPSFPSSATDHTVLFLRWWESSRWTCQVSFEIILSDGRAHKETSWCRISSVLIFSTLKTVGWYRVMKDKALDLVCQNTDPFSWTIFRSIQKTASRYTCHQVLHGTFRGFVTSYGSSSWESVMGFTAVQNAVCRQEKNQRDRCTQSNCKEFSLYLAVKDQL